jgi:hypothetical protein
MFKYSYYSIYFTILYHYGENKKYLLTILAIAGAYGSHVIPQRGMQMGAEMQTEQRDAVGGGCTTAAYHRNVCLLHDGFCDIRCR